MKTWKDFEPQSRDRWRADEITLAAIAMLTSLMEREGDAVIGFASNASAEATNAMRFHAGVREGLRLAISNMKTEPKT